MDQAIRQLNLSLRKAEATDTIADVDRLKALAVEIINTPEHWQHWTHSVCHLFEGWGTEDGGISLLDNPAYLGVASDLINEALRRATEAGLLSSFPRIIGVLPSYNLAALGLNDLDASYRFRPRF